MSYQSYPVNAVIPTKNIGTALLLSLLFGPIGMFYSTISGAVLMSILSLFLLAFQFGIWLVALWPILLIWTAITVYHHNKKVWDKIIYYKRETLKIRAYNSI